MMVLIGWLCFVGKDLLSKYNGTERTHYVAATEEVWDYIPRGLDKCSGEAFDEETVGRTPCNRAMHVTHTLSIVCTLRTNVFNTHALP